MYVCICNAIRDSELRRAGRRSGADAVSVYAMLGKRPQCGQCLEEAEHILDDERARAGGLTLVAA
jgi:bacterioferritin-associated ferredoxin